MGRQSTTKVGKRSSAQKETNARYDYQSTPASRKVSGAFGKEKSNSAARTTSKTGEAGRERTKRGQ